jgi:hypothetical protein
MIGPISSERVTLAGARCVVDIESQRSESGQPRFVARMSVVDGDGSVVRPLVGADGGRVKIHATSARLALRVALSYLEGRFGRVVASDRTASLAEATVGLPWRVDAR